MDLLAQIHSAQSDLDQLIAQLGNDAGSVLTGGQSQRQLLVALEQRLTSGAVASPALIRNQIAGAIAATANLGDQARQLNSQRASLDLASAQERTRATAMEIGRDIYQHRIFDPYLRFTSVEDEEAYRRREEDNRRAVERALAENTPEGDLRATRILERQLQDAASHGADASPQFADYAARIRCDQGNLERAIASRDETAGDRQRAHPSPEAPPPATEDQLASVLATFRAAGIAGGAQADHAAHGLVVNASSPNRTPGAAI
jgi:hypothetical protein